MKLTPHTRISTDGPSPRGWKTRAIITDSHFLIPLTVFCIGLAILITLR
jgi:hypothetical protein